MPLFFRWADNHSAEVGKPKNRSTYRPQPIWFAMNHNPIIETGTPSNQATPYFIITPLEQFCNANFATCVPDRLGITVAMRYSGGRDENA
jgi:hypothetical protein